MALDLIAELEALVDAMSAEGVPYALCGGLAVGIHGHPRATMDIDLLVRSEDVTRAIEVAKRLGFDVPARKMVFGLRTGATLEMQRVSKLDPQTADLLPLDLIVVGPELESVWNDRVAFQVGGRQMVIVSRGGLVTMKRLAARPQDLADIAALEGTNDDPTE